MSDEIQILRPQGRLDSASSPVLEQQAFALIEAGGRLLLIDFDGLAYISSAGLRAALAVAKRMSAAGGRLALCSLSPQVAEVFEISGVNTIIDIHPSAESAAQRLLAG
ncbi:MAG TPA: STAS domain-containing protein [Caulobacteraceae bacterium]|nr:STAS domain-containing protein [Caulobacteraceae bacterium]